MFSAISDGGAPAYENLSNYFLGGATRARPAPGGVPSKRARDAREPSKPGQQPSNGRTPIPTSSQKPGNREGNQRIPYARMMFTSMEDKAAPREIKGGDVIFVHKTSCAMGGAPNRCNKCTSIPQLNAILSKASAGVTTLDLSDPTLAARIKEARMNFLTGLLQTYANRLAGAEIRGDAELVTELTNEIGKIEAFVESVRTAPDIEEFVPLVDWTAVKMLSDWSLDGVLISTDDDVELDDTNQPQLSRDDGVLMNVCVQGPTPMRNTAPQISSSVESHMWNPQHIDQGIHVMDKVFVGLFYKINDDGSVVSFYYSLFSGRQALAMRKGGAERGVDSYADGPTDQEFLRCVGAWRVGSVMDNKLTTTVDRHIQVNVVVEWWTVNDLREAYDVSIGKFEDLKLTAPSASAAAAAVGFLDEPEEPTVIAVGEDEEAGGTDDEDEEAILLRQAARAKASAEASRRANQRAGTVRASLSKQLAALAREL